MEFALQNDGNLPPSDEVEEGSSCDEESDSDDDEVLDLNPDKDLPYFANLWRKLADWTTNDTRIWIADRNNAVMLGENLKNEVSIARYNAFCSQLKKALDVVLPILLDCSKHRICLDKIFEIAKTLKYHEAISNKAVTEV